MRFITNIIWLLLVGLILAQLGTELVYAAEIDDASIFVDAFAAYQKKDYLLSIEKIDQLNQLFPDTPLRDVLLLLAARSSYKAGDNQRAAKSVMSFIAEFPESSLKSTIEEELLALSNRQKKGEALPPNKQLQSVARKVRLERLAQERLAAVKLEKERLAKEKNERERIAFEKAEVERRANELAAAEKLAAMKLEQERLTKEKNERERIALEKAEAERRANELIAAEKLAVAKLEQERLTKEKNERERIALEKAEAERRAFELAAAEKAAKESIKIAIMIQDSGTTAVVGEKGSLPVEISNHGKNNEEFILDVVAPAEYSAYISQADKGTVAIKRIQLAAGETFKGALVFRMPAEKIDGTRTSLILKATSALYSDVVQQKNSVVITSAPLVRVVTKLSKSQAISDELLRYKVSIINIGSMTAQKLMVRVKLPTQLDFQGAQDMKFKLEPDGELTFTVEQIESGKLAEIIMDVKVRDNSRIDQQWQGVIEIIEGQLLRKDIFTVNVAAVQAKQKPNSN